MIVNRENLIENIISITQASTLYCFGAGAMGRDFCDFAKDFGFPLDKIIFVDNDSEKIGKHVEIDQFKINILSKHQMLSNIKTDDIIVIATLACKEIFEDLLKYQTLDNIQVCFSQLLLTNKLNGKTPNIKQKNRNQIVPKTIHYCWFGKNKLPSEWKKYIDGWQEKCPEYKIIQWDEDNYDISKNKYMLQAYQAKRYGFVSDYARLDIIYNYGGIYLDADVELLKSLDSFLTYNCFFSINATLKVNTGNGFGATPKHRLIKDMLDYYNNIEFLSSDGTINSTPCMEHQYKVLKNNNFKITGGFAYYDDYVVFPLQVICGYNHYIDRYMIDENTVAVHHSERTWHDNNMRKHAKESVDYLSIFL